MRALLTRLTTVAIAVLVLAFAASPALAYRSIDRSVTTAGTERGYTKGKIWMKNSNTIGWDLTVGDISRDGNCVYVQYQGIRRGQPDTGWFRLTKDTCGVYVKKHRTATRDVIGPGILDLDGLRVKVCVKRTGPDQCGGRSVIAYKDYNTPG